MLLEVPKEARLVFLRIFMFTIATIRLFVMSLCLDSQPFCSGGECSHPFLPFENVLSYNWDMSLHWVRTVAVYFLLKLAFLVELW